jgi:DNA-binding Lrp family transcriptional regulator
MALDAFDRALIAATQGGLPLVARPYEAVGAMLGVPGEQVRERLEHMLAQGLVRRIGAVPNHYRLGYTANGMSVWDVANEHVATLGPRVAALPGVSHCPRHLPGWPYNLFAMLHGTSRESVAQQAGEIAALLGGACRGHDILYSTAILKKTGLRLKD